MKLAIVASYFLAALVFFSCKSTQEIKGDGLIGPTWELEYLSGPRIAFQGLFRERKPKISFQKDTKKVEGNAGCNGYTTDYKLNGRSISFSQPGPTTRMYCGEGEKHFLNAMRKVDGYNIDENGKLNLLAGPVPMLRFHPVNE
ncbi:META domain-containing protein [Pareuzebyella sediminis]|uniref:META domain-containing protein n=1 Tax=Pareuzebyella sediminis TaxID=2607998 RepID=UPI0011EE77F7|nr:META domain-containing protein [Pareuzebyella sediminis]